MDLSSYLPFIIGFALFAITFVIRSSLKKKSEDKNKPAVLKKEVVQEAPVVPQYGPLNIYFGSQTGTAHNYSKILSDEAIKSGFEAKVIDLATFDPESFPVKEPSLFLMATHGEGEPPENAKKFNEYIEAPERTGTELAGLKYSVFALGNKQYQFFCGQGKRTNDVLSKLGGEKIYKYGEGDDNENLEDDFNKWKEGMWDEIIAYVKAHPTEQNGASMPPKHQPEQKRAGNKSENQSGSGLPFTVKMTPGAQEIDIETFTGEGKDYEFQVKQYLSGANAKFTLARELRQKIDDGSTLHIEIDSKAAGLTYKTAQNLAIYPENNPEIVERTAFVLGYNLDDVFTIESNGDARDFKHPVPSPISVRTYLTRFCDLQSQVRKKQLKDLSEFCSSEDNKNKLLVLASNEGKTEFKVQIADRMKGLADIIEDFGIQVPLDQLIQISSVILPRLYTIASSNKKNPDSIHLCASISEDTLPGGKKKMGLASDFFVRQFKGYSQGKAMGFARMAVKDSTFVLPEGDAVPVIMVGPGAGIAPFKGFIDEKAFLAENGDANPYGEMTLYFGCKGENWDHLYRDEMVKYHADKYLKDYHIAFSRQQAEKVYVQDLLERNREEVAEIMFERNGTFYICGSMSMGKAVMAKLAQIAAQHSKVDAKEGQTRIEAMEKNKKIIKELWG